MKNLDGVFFSLRHVGMALVLMAAFVGYAPSGHADQATDKRVLEACWMDVEGLKNQNDVDSFGAGFEDDPTDSPTLRSNMAIASQEAGCQRLQEDYNRRYAAATASKPQQAPVRPVVKAKAPKPTKSVKASKNVGSVKSSRFAAAKVPKKKTSICRSASANRKRKVCLAGG